MTSEQAKGSEVARNTNCHSLQLLFLKELGMMDPVPQACISETWLQDDGKQNKPHVITMHCLMHF
eukprot:4009332-Amphidinium_carterae.1